MKEKMKEKKLEGMFADMRIKEMGVREKISELSLEDYKVFKKIELDYFYDRHCINWENYSEPTEQDRTGIRGLSYDRLMMRKTGEKYD